MTREPESLDVTKYKTNDKIEKPLKNPPRNIHIIKVNFDKSKDLYRGTELFILLVVPKKNTLEYQFNLIRQTHIKINLI